jgi:hypothetical protein
LIRLLVREYTFLACFCPKNEGVTQKKLYIGKKIRIRNPVRNSDPEPDPDGSEHLDPDLDHKSTVPAILDSGIVNPCFAPNLVCK